jgi:catechol 2,3-dioxygenase-like lactoylglutathione lyase family enzyme
MPAPLTLLECCLYVDDLEAAERFYRDVLGLELYSRQARRHVFFRCGRQMLLLFDPRATRDPESSLPLHGAQGAGHLAFAAQEAEVEAWLDSLRQHGVPIERVVTWPDGTRSLYFRDPAGNSLEIAAPRLWELRPT